MKNNKKFLLYLSVLLIILLQLFFLYYTKYKIHGLEISDFRIDAIGNFINLVISLVLIAGVTVFIFSNADNSPAKLLFSYLLVLTLLLLGASFFVRIGSPFGKNYLFGQPVEKLLTGLMFYLYQFVQLVFTITLWLKSFGRKDWVFISSSLNSLIVLMLLIVFSYYFVSSADQESDPNRLKDEGEIIGVVLGAAVWSDNIPSPSLSARVDKAVELYRSGIIDKIQLTGSNAPGELTEAEVALEYIMKNNIRVKDVFIEKQTTSTVEQVNYIKNNLLRNTNTAGIIMISDKYHLARIMEISKFYNVPVGLRASDLQLTFKTKVQIFLRESVAMLSFWLFAI
ncbi:MAG: hypothetical protein Kow0098_23530 [Ignavibacteriaceae bacterium]